MVTTLLRPVIASCGTISTAEHLKALLPPSVNSAVPTPAPLLHVPLAQEPLQNAGRIDRLAGGLIACVHLPSATFYILKWLGSVSRFCF